MRQARTETVVALLLCPDSPSCDSRVQPTARSRRGWPVARPPAGHEWHGSSFFFFFFESIAVRIVSIYLSYYHGRHSTNSLIRGCSAPQTRSYLCLLGDPWRSTGTSPRSAVTTLTISCMPFFFFLFSVFRARLVVPCPVTLFHVRVRTRVPQRTL